MSLELAIAYAKDNPITPVGRNSISRFAAMLYDGDGRGVLGYNSYRTHPLQAKFGSNESSIHTHAEIDAIVKMIRLRARQGGLHYADITDLSDCHMFVARVLRNGSPALARPCEGCWRALAAFGITEVEWTT